MIAKSGSYYMAKVRNIYFLLAFMLLPAFELTAQDVRVESSFEPDVVRNGESCEYILTIFNAGGSIKWKIPMPRELNVVGNSSYSSFMFENGRQTLANKKTLTIVPTKPGKFTVKEYEIEIANQRLIVPPATLTVLNKRTPSQAVQRNQVQPTPNVGNQGGSAGPMIELVLPREKLYVGESAFSQIKLYIPNQLRVRKLPLPIAEGDDFSIGKYIAPRYNFSRGKTSSIIGPADPP